MRVGVQGQQLEMTEGGHDKFYRLLVVAPSGGTSGLHFLVVCWGRRGAAGQFKVTAHPSGSAALAARSAQGWAKERKGYRLVVPDLSFEVEVDTSDLARPRPLSAPAALSGAFEAALLEKVWRPRLEDLSRSVLGEPSRVVLLPGFRSQVRTQGWAKEVEVLLSALPSASARAGDLSAFSVPTSAAAWFHLHWRAPNRAVVLGVPAPAAVLETFLGLYAPRSAGAMADPGSALEAALLLAPVG